MDRVDRVLVVGGGIAGLGTARALSRQGIECDVVERADGLNHAGAGMYLPANSVRALEVLGAPVRGRARDIARQRFLDERGRVLLDVDLARFWKVTGPCVGIGRRQLHEILREGNAVRMSTTVMALHQDGQRVRAVFDDGSDGDYDLVVGADGVRSWVRVVACGGTEPRFVGQVSWRFLVHGFSEVSQWTVWLGRGRAFLALPLRDGLTYCYADLDTPETTDPTGGDPAALSELFADFSDPVPAMLAAGPATGQSPYFSPVEEVVHEPWVHGQVALVGDAAHAMSPNMAEGAGMALEDALVLGDTIASGEPLETFEARRRPRVTFVQAQTRRRDRTRRLPSSVRNCALRFVGQRIFRANYATLRAEP